MWKPQLKTLVTIQLSHIRKKCQLVAHKEQSEQHFDKCLEHHEANPEVPKATKTRDPTAGSLVEKAEESEGESYENSKAEKWYSLIDRHLQKFLNSQFPYCTTYHWPK